MAFVKRYLNVSFGMSTGSFAGGGNSQTLTGLRVSAKIVRAGSTAMSELECVIFGMPLQLMNQYSTLGMRIRDIVSNTITLQAKEGETGSFSTVFSGNVRNAWIDAKSQPEVCFRVQGNEAFAMAGQKVPVTSFDGKTPLTTVLQSMAAQAVPPLTFENNGVNVQLSNPYFPGSLRTQILDAIHAGGVDGGVVENNVLAIWPQDKSRQGKIVTISPTTGMVGYPAFTEQGILVQMEYNPNIVSGGQLIVQDSQIQGANGTWSIGGVTQDLESEMPGGMWFTSVSAYSANAGAFIPAKAN